MLLKPRLFERQPPSRDAKTIYIFCEGVKTEKEYFQYFSEIDSRVNVCVYELHPHANNSPLGLLSIAEECLLKSDKNPNPEYELIEGDEVWIVLDTDPDKFNSREKQIEVLQHKCLENDWQIAISNPCFEVWLYYHFFNGKPEMDDIEYCKTWKQKLHIEKSGFKTSKHSIFIPEACLNSEINYRETDLVPHVGSTQVHNLGSKIYALLKEKIDTAREQIENS